MEDFKRALSTLEYDKILEMLADCARTEGACDKARRLRPTGDAVRVRQLLTQTDEAKHLIQLKGHPSFGSVKDVNPSLERAEKGAMLTMRELLDVAGVLRTARLLIDYIRTDKNFETTLDVIFDRLNANRPLEEHITRAIIAEDMIADEASPALAEIRRKIRYTGSKIKDILQKYTSGGEFSKYLQENIVTSRGGRYVVPVKNEFKNEVRGLVHDTSASGATVFIEPIAVVEANNELRELESKEKHEIERILLALSGECAACSGIISLDYYNITELAFIFARAELSYRMDAVSPRISDKREIELISARHPLLDAKKVVPIHVRLGGEFDTLVITGPNTGGKTVTLKTLGLFALMVQSGLHIPAADTSVMCVFSSVQADIGDEQSIEQSLSTFSAHMVNIVEILKEADDESLVLFDELGAGTDPVEGAALAVSILESVRDRGCLCAATTHYAELKEYALETDGVCNASCEFDVETLKPTYKLVIGTPGRSNAFAISLKLGLDEAVVERARTYVSSSNRRFEDVIEQLERSRIDMERQRAEASQMRREYEAFKEQSERELKAKTAAAEKELDKARAKAVQMVESARLSADYVYAQLAEVKKLRESDRLAEELEKARDNIRHRLDETDAQVNPVIEKKDENYVLPRPLKKGDEVLIINIHKRGVLLETPGSDGSVAVQAGIIKTRTDIRNLKLIEPGSIHEEDKPKQRSGGGGKSFEERLRTDFRPELDLRGMNGEDAWFMIDKYLDDAKMASVNTVTLIHGKGTGALRKSVWNHLKNEPRVKSFRPGAYGEGDAGVTVVEIK